MKTVRKFTIEIREMQENDAWYRQHAVYDGEGKLVYMDKDRIDLWKRVNTSPIRKFEEWLATGQKPIYYTTLQMRWKLLKAAFFGLKPSTIDKLSAISGYMKVEEVPMQ